MKWVVVLLSILSTSISQKSETDSRAIWGYECQKNQCVRTEITNNNADKIISFPVCRIFCGSELGTIWPKPTGTVKISDMLLHFSLQTLTFVLPNHENQREFWTWNRDRFIEQLKTKLESPKAAPFGGGKFLNININVANSDLRLSLDTDESYSIGSRMTDDIAQIDINANTFYGARHGLETLSQLIVFDNIRNEYLIVQDIEITDAPVYKYRGILLDTARNYYSVESIKRTIEGMAMTKLNTFHWHITDSQSFPMVLKSLPELAEYGAYSKYKVYTPEEIRDIVRFGKSRGVRVLPEFDAPAHVGEGWQKHNVTTCFNYQPWQKYCVEPPCGQFDPSKDKLYDLLEKLYAEMYDLFDSPDIFHMGGDEVSISCWDTSAELKKWMTSKGWSFTDADYMKVWGYFQQKALERFDKVANSSAPIILWTSRLTKEPFVNQYLDKDRYIIQIWEKLGDPQIPNLVESGYKLIVSHYDELYLDCGFGGWVTDGNNWCAPYKEWQKIYLSDPSKIATPDRMSQVLGSEVALWSEQSDEFSLDTRLWPRSSALAERLWSNPQGTWRDAEQRMLVHRKRLVENGISADRLQPEWCLRNEDQCKV